MDRKSQLLVYGRDERPSNARLALLGLQHLVLVLMLIVYPVMAAHGLGLGGARQVQFLTIAILVVGLGTILQSLPAPWGSGHLHVHQPSPIFLPLVIQTQAFGGMAALAPLLVLGGLGQIAVARVLRFLRRAFPPEVMGIVVVLLGISLVPGALDRCFDDAFRAGRMEAPLVASATLATIVGISVYSRGVLRLFSMLIGAVVGVSLAGALGMFGAEDLRQLAAAPYFALPALTLQPWVIEWQLVPLAALVVCIHTLDALGAHVSAQKLADADWQRADMRTAGRAIRAVGSGNVLAGLLGGYPAGLSSASIGLAFTTGAVAWRIGLAAGLLAVACAFVPKVPVFLSILPEPVVAAIVFNAAAFMIASGMELIFSRLMNTRRIFMVGLATIVGLAGMLRPDLALALPLWMRPVVASPLFLGATVAIALNLLFRIGIAQHERVILRRGEPLPARLRDLFERKGLDWGLRRTLVEHAQLGTMQALEALFESDLLQAPHEVALLLRYDDLHIDVVLEYRGGPLPIGAPRPTPDELLEDDAALARMTAHIVARLADACRARTVGDLQRLELRFDS
ncbi:MAG: uracil-xanthine permease family protein [Alphaproteobacteria bacterium]